MDWSQLTPDLLFLVLKLLKPRERLTCSLVCRTWYDAISMYPILLNDYVVKINPRSAREVQRLIGASKRQFRQLYVELEANDYSVGECVTEAVHRVDIQFLWLIGEPEHVKFFMESQTTMFASLTELRLEFSANTSWEVYASLNVFLENLKEFHYLQIYGPNPEQVIFNLIAPKLEKAYILLDSLANEEIAYWEDPLIELRECTQLKSLYVDLKGSMWDNFFDVERVHLERLVLRRAIDEIDTRDWNRLFINMPNLRYVEFICSTNAMLTSLRRYCNKIQSLQITGFNFYDGNFASCLSMPTLEQVHLDGWMNGGIFTGETMLQLNNLKELTWKYAELTAAMGSFRLVTPALKSVTLRGCDYRKFLLHVEGNRLESIDLDCYDDQWQEIPSFFACLDNLQQLTLNTNTKALRLVQTIGPLAQLKRLEVFCYTERNENECNALFAGLCAICPQLEWFSLVKENLGELILSCECLLELKQMRALKYLTLRYITIRDAKHEIRIDNLIHLEVSSCVLSGSGESFPIVSANVGNVL
ncbi:uncharacterized protein LOC129777765 [Toxorhynchites rutilus septentrionalis]|uniref:uncharacterized protein LOC129777765 n=1 Tax=Toxorhynchites rutilus septentrionalis TaxID=329112 RepID=UPI00247A2B97|nr:uncharacterized protein LOC129777765 [Toxorhynchites rutilus septentrionalis]